MAPLPLLATPEDLAVLVRKSPTDPKVRLALKRASGRFRDAVGYQVSQVVDDTLTRLGNGTDVMLLKGAPVTAVSVSSGAETIPADSYTLDAEAGILYAVDSVWNWRTPFTITYTHGYAEIPEGIEDAVLEQAVTQCLAFAHVQQETAATNNASYGKEATVGIKKKWTDAVLTYRLRGRA